MISHRYTLEPYGNGRNTRFTCPSCNKKREFTRYIDTETDKYVHDSVGSCNRKSNCSYHYTPKQFFSDNPWLQETLQPVANGLQPKSNLKSNTGLQAIKPRFGSPFQSVAVRCNALQQPASLISPELFRESRQYYGQNNFALFLKNKLGVEIAEKLIALYHIGTSKKWLGATIFWQIDQKVNIRAGKIMLYDTATGKRVKKPFNHLTWVHSVLKLKDYNLQQCFFGEHLLRQFPNKPVAIAESEKTAVICSFYLPKYIWLSPGGINNLTYEKCLVLKGRNVTLFPDLNGYEEWSLKAKDWSNITPFKVSDILERIATAKQKQEGLDLADFL